jgi:hypothetical protein
MDFTDEIVKKYVRINKELIKKMYADLALENPADMKCCQVQGAVLEASHDKVYDASFMKNFCLNRDLVYDTDAPIDDESDMTGCFMTDGYDFGSWPMNASQIGYLTNEEASERFDIRKSEKVNVGKHLTITFAAASQGGYYPSNRTKANQDAYNSGVVKKSSKVDKNFGVFFSVFDGHGSKGTECSLDTSRHVSEHVIASVAESIDNTMHKQKYDLSSSTHRRTMDLSSYTHRASSSMYRSMHVNIGSSFHRSMSIDFDEEVHGAARHDVSAVPMLNSKMM